MKNSLLLKSNQLIDYLSKGSPIGFPTDTVPALAANPDNAFHLWKIKNRPKTKPLILIGSSADELFSYVLQDALNMGLSKRDVKKILKARGLGKREIRQLFRGKFTPANYNKDLMDKRYKKAKRAYPDEQVIKSYFYPKAELTSDISSIIDLSRETEKAIEKFVDYIRGALPNDSGEGTIKLKFSLAILSILSLRESRFTSAEIIFTPFFLSSKIFCK